MDPGTGCRGRTPPAEHLVADVSVSIAKQRIGWRFQSGAPMIDRADDSDEHDDQDLAEKQEFDAETRKDNFAKL